MTHILMILPKNCHFIVSLIDGVPLTLPKMSFTSSGYFPISIVPILIIPFVFLVDPLFARRNILVLAENDSCRPYESPALNFISPAAETTSSFAQLHMIQVESWIT